MSDKWTPEMATAEEALAAYQRFADEHRRTGGDGPVIVSPKLYARLVDLGIIEASVDEGPFFEP